MTMMAQDVATLKRLNFHYEEIQRQQQEVQNILREWRWRCAMSTNQPTSLQMQPLLQSHMQPRLGPAGLQDPQGLRDLRGPQDLQGLWGLRRPPGLPQSLPGLGARGPAGLSAPCGLAANMAANIAVNPLGRVGSMPGGMVHPTDPQHYMRSDFAAVAPTALPNGRYAIKGSWSPRAKWGRASGNPRQCALAAFSM